MWLHLSNAQIRVIISFVPYRFCLPAAAEHVCLTFFFYSHGPAEDSNMHSVL